jgi:predicted enzyme related to lactoylglutathione lyase
MTLLIDCITLDCADAKRVATFWAAALGYETMEEKEGDWMALRPAQGAGPLLGFQQVPEPKVGKNRLHLDLRPAAGVTMEAEVARLEGLGATAVRRVTNGPDKVHMIMQDPESNEFCVVRP